MKSEIKLLDADSISLGMIEEYAGEFHSREDKPNKQDIVFKMVRAAVKQLRPNSDPEYMRHIEVTERLQKIERRLEREPAPRAEQLAKAKCIAVARLLWKQNPNFTRAELSKHPDVYCKETDGGGYTQRTVYEWIEEADPRAKEDRAGRPRKEK